MGLSIKQIRAGTPGIEDQLSSGSGFRDAFSQITGAPRSKIGNRLVSKLPLVEKIRYFSTNLSQNFESMCSHMVEKFYDKDAKNGNFSDRMEFRNKSNGKVLEASWLDTLLGPMLAIANEEALYLLEFVDRRGLEKKVDRLQQKTKSAIIQGCTEPILEIENELRQYFEGKIREFKTPLLLLGSPFQKQVWEELKKIPPGKTRSYSDIARGIGRPSSFRAVAQANGANQLALVIPCHRVINANGELGGYSGGLIRKKWLLNHEKEAN